MVLARIMIVRHAEKPDATERGVAVDGSRDKHDLSVIGWQRAGALPRFFAPGAASSPHPFVAAPRTIFASKVTKKSKSRRAVHTVKPVAALLAIPVDDTHRLGREERLAAAATAATMPVLIAWHHDHIPDLARAIVGDDASIPARWPDDRFDLIWVLDADDRGRWRLSQVPQMLLPGDRTDAIA